MAWSNQKRRWSDFIRYVKGEKAVRPREYGFRPSTMLVVAVILTYVLPAYVFSQTDFYKGKTITVIQGREPGGHRRRASQGPYTLPAEIHSRKSDCSV